MKLDLPPRARWLVWALLAAPAVIHIALLLYTTFSRVGYPYDLEWMEGGLLDHAARIASGDGIYVKPSVEFVPYLYTPLYPGLLAALGSIFGISYTLGRVISILSMLGTMALMVSAVFRERGEVSRRVAITCAIIGVGYFAATYPWVDGWYDIVRADGLMLLLAVGGLLGIRAWAKSGDGPRALLRIAACASLLTLAYFAKQTGVLFVAAGGAMLLVLNWRRLPIYIATAGFVGLGGTWLLNGTSGGWFWTYAYKVHQHHDFNHDRFFKAFTDMIGHFPAMTAIIVIALAAVIATGIKHRKVGHGTAGFLAWGFVFLVGLVAGALGFATQFAHFNAYIPAMTLGAITSGCGIIAICGCAKLWVDGMAGARKKQLAGFPEVAAAAFTLVLSIQLGLSASADWHPSRLIPTDGDRMAGAELIERLRGYDGEVWVPYHPWYAHLAGKATYAHRMGLIDIGVTKKWKVDGVRKALRDQDFAAVVLDNRPIGRYLDGLKTGYKLGDLIPGAHSPRTRTGALVQPRSIWVPPIPVDPPEGAKVVFNFEDHRLSGWISAGRAWGNRPVFRPLRDQGAVYGYGGKYYLSSMHGGDAATGTLTSPPFTITGERITIRVSGGRDAELLRAELVVDGEVKKTATGTGGEGMTPVSWTVLPLVGKRAELRLVDESTASWGHLNVDEVWIWK